MSTSAKAMLGVWRVVVEGSWNDMVPEDFPADYSRAFSFSLTVAIAIFLLPLCGRK